MAKVEQVIQRKDGSEVKIGAQACFGLGMAYSVDVYVHRRESPDHAWVLMGNRPHPDWRDMPVEQYVAHGRPEMLRVATMGEILRATNALHTQLTTI